MTRCIHWSTFALSTAGYFVCVFIPRSFPTPRRTGHPDSMEADGTSCTRWACEVRLHLVLSFQEYENDSFSAQEHRHKQLQR